MRNYYSHGKLLGPVRFHTRQCIGAQNPVILQTTRVMLKQHPTTSINPPHDASHGYSVTVEAPQEDVMYYVIHAVIDGKDLYVARGERTIPLKVAGVAPVEEIPSQVKETGAPAAGMDNTIMLGAGVAIVVVAVAVVVLARRRKAV
ncbi:MAG: hypothetical protein FJ358_02295 [Thaumarchaeota archaeon]|nr:hypothetical protein [Nitrososphaerota archaeon]